MHSIDTHIQQIRVEIEGTVYPVAEKTADVAEALLDAQQRGTGRPVYRLWLAELEILLGRSAVRRLFPAGSGENLDRMERIHAGVLRAFEHNHDRLTDAMARDSASQISAALSPINELLGRLAELGEDAAVVHRR